MIFEDGRQSRDFVHVSDVVQALELALDRSDVADVALNVGTGRPTSVAAIARGLAEGLGVHVAPQLVGKFREGDIRHCVADVQRITRTLGYAPRVRLEDGLTELAQWSRGEQAVDRVAHAQAELERKGLIR
jgi:dTDP-L-rhamnose 4-epimerase